MLPKIQYAIGTFKSLKILMKRHILYLLFTTDTYDKDYIPVVLRILRLGPSLSISPIQCLEALLDIVLRYRDR